MASDSNNQPASSEPLGINGIINALGDDNDKEDITLVDSDGGSEDQEEEVDLLADDKTDKSNKKKKDKESEESDDDQEEELELNADDDIAINHVSTKEILTKYPTLFKDFPYLKAVYYREQEYTELLPTIDDAKEAIERANNFTNFEQQLLNGNTEVVLKSVKETDSKAYDKIVNNYLDTLGKVDKDAYYHVVGSVLDKLIGGMVQEATNSSNENLRAAALIVNQFIGRGSQMRAPSKFGNQTENPETDKEKLEIQKEREKFNQEKTNAVVEELSTKTTNVLRSTIAQNIDPRGVMPPYVKRNAINDALKSVQDSINEDKRFRTILDNLWKDASKQNFSRASQDRIRTAYLSKSKTLLRNAILKTRTEALQGLGKRDNNDDKDRRGNLPVGRSGASNKDNNASSGNKSSNTTIPKGMSNKQFIMSD